MGTVALCHRLRRATKHRRSGGRAAATTTYSRLLDSEHIAIASVESELARVCALVASALEEGARMKKRCIVHRLQPEFEGALGVDRRQLRRPIGGQLASSNDINCMVASPSLPLSVRRLVAPSQNLAYCKQKVRLEQSR